MPVVIDLLSSPDLPQLARATTTANDAAPKKYPSKAPNYKASKTSNDDWFTLSSNSPEPDEFRPPPMPVSKPSITKTSTIASSTITSTNARPSLNTTSKPSQSTHTLKPSNDFLYLSDDFDRTVNLDDPSVVDPPPAKKRRLSPPTDPSVISRSPEYQRWVKRLEKSTISGSNTEFSKNDAVMETSTKPTAVATMVRGEISKTITTSASTYKRWASDLETSGKYAASSKSAGGLKRSKTMGAPVESDPIVFTSSPDPAISGRKRKEKAKDSRIRDRVNDLLADFSDDEGLDLYAPKKKKGKEKPIESDAESSSHGAALQEYDFDSSDIDLPDIGAMSRSHAVKTGNGKSAAMTALERYEAEKVKEKKEKAKEQKAKEKDQKAKSKVAAKEVEKEQKRLAKEDKARAKGRAAELAKVNILKTDKKKSTLEMIVDLPSCLESRIMEQIQTFLKPVGAEYSVYESSQRIIKWRRKIDSEYDEEAGHWDTVNPYIRAEKHVMCIINATEFVELATAEEGKDLESHVVRLKAKFSTDNIIYLIEGLEPWMRKNKNVQNRKYVQEVRNQGLENEAIPTTSQKRRKKPEPEYLDQDLIEDTLLKLQVMHGVLIHHTRVAVETAEWVIVFTQHISTIPYRYVFFPPKPFTH